MSDIKKIRKPLIITVAAIYAISLIGIPLSIQASEYLKISSYFMLATTVVLAIFHEGDVKRSAIVFGVIAFLGWLVEVVGVKTGLLFGSYQYGESLGIKVLDTPLLIGLNWAALVYMAYASTQMLEMNNRRMAAVGGILVLYDILLEPAAAKLGMWQFAGNEVPFQNYVIWFMVAYIFAQMVRASKVSYRNSIATPMLIIQIAFFLLLDIIFLTTKL